MKLRYLPLALVSLAVLCGQTPKPRMEFEVASIKPSAPLTGGNQVTAGVHIDGAQVRCNMMSLRDYIAIAYELKIHQVIGPEWMAGERFDIAAKVPEGAKRDDFSVMLQNLLADRFQMKTHRDKKEFPVYGLVIGRGGLKIKESEPDPPAAEGVNPAEAPVNVTASGGPRGTTINFGNGASFSISNNKFTVKKLTLADFAESLGRFADRPVVDATEQKGKYDFELEFTPEDFRAMMVRSAIAAGIVLPPQAMQALEASGDSLFTAVQTLGLRLESRKAPVDVLVIDSVLKMPTEN